MTREEKNAAIEAIKSAVSESPVLYLADTSALDASATSDLRRECFKQGIKMQVVKNTLLRKALESIEDRDFAPLLETLKGNTSVMYAEVGNAPAKLIKEFRKTHDKPVLKGAYVEQECYIGDDQLQALVDIKSKEELIGDVIGMLQSPIKNVIGSLQSGGGTLAGLLKSLEERA